MKAPSRASASPAPPPACGTDTCTDRVNASARRRVSRRIDASAAREYSGATTDAALATVASTSTMRAVLRRNHSPASASRRLVPRPPARSRRPHRPSRSRAGTAAAASARPTTTDTAQSTTRQPATVTAPLPRPGRGPPAAGRPRRRTAARRAVRPARRPGRGSCRPARRARPPRGAHGPTRTGPSRPGHRRCAGRPGRGPGWRPRWRRRRRAPPRRAPRRPARPAGRAAARGSGPRWRRHPRAHRPCRGTARAARGRRGRGAGPARGRGRQRPATRRTTSGPATRDGPVSSAARSTSTPLVPERGICGTAPTIRNAASPVPRSWARTWRPTRLGVDGSSGRLPVHSATGTTGRSWRWAATGTPNEVPLSLRVGPGVHEGVVEGVRAPGQRLPGSERPRCRGRRRPASPRCRRAPGGRRARPGRRRSRRTCGWRPPGRGGNPACSRWPRGRCGALRATGPGRPGGRPRSRR